MRFLKALIVLSVLVSLSAMAEYADLSQGKTYYKLRDTGADKNVVLVHAGKFASWTISGMVNPIAAEGFNVARFDFYGMGKSDRLSSGEYNRADFQKQLSEFIDHLGWKDSGKPLYLVGSGTGASIAAMYAVANPHSVEKLVVLNPAFDAKATRSWKQRAFVAAMRQAPESLVMRDILKEQVTEAVEHMAEIIGGTNGAFLLSRYKRLLEGDYIDGMYRRLIGDLWNSYSMTYERLGRMNFPMFVIAGEVDNSFPANHRSQLIGGYRLTQFIKVKVYPRMGSELTTVKKKEVAEDIVEYLNQ